MHSLSRRRRVPAAVALAASLWCAPAAVAQQPATEAAAPRATVSGVVFDSIGRAPLADATVQIAHLTDPARLVRSARTDSAGRFTLADVPAGHYVAGFIHPLLDSLGIEAPVTRLEVAGDRAVRLDLGVPSAARLRAALCGPDGAEPTGVLVGTLFDAATRHPVDSGVVQATWVAFSMAGNRLVRDVPRRATRSGDGGWFALCGLPAMGDFSVRAVRGADTSGVVSLQMPGTGLTRHDLYVGDVVAVAAGGADSGAAPGAASVGATPSRGRARLSGVVRGADHRPLAGAQVQLAGSRAEAVTNDSGRFDLRGLPGGTQTLMVRKVGYYPDRRVVEIVAGRDASLEITLPTLKNVLDTVRVTATRLFDRFRGEFEQRRKANPGYFFDEDDIARAMAISMVDIVRRVPSASVVEVPAPGSAGARYLERLHVRGVTSITGGGKACLPDVWVDRSKVALSEDLKELDQIVRPDEIRAMEFYTPEEAPVEYHTMNGCASLIIWTGPPRPVGSR